MEKLSLLAYLDTVEEAADSNRLHITFDCTLLPANGEKLPQSRGEEEKWLVNAPIYIVQTIEPIPIESLRNEQEWCSIILTKKRLRPNDIEVRVSDVSGDNTDIEQSIYYLSARSITPHSAAFRLISPNESIPGNEIKEILGDLFSKKLNNDFSDIKNYCKALTGRNDLFAALIIHPQSFSQLDNPITHAICIKVGQGNLTSFLDLNGTVVAYFDFGTGCYFNSQTRPKEFNTPAMLMKAINYNPEDPAPVFLSHYDADHYFAARLLGKATIKGIWFLPSHCPLPQGPAFRRFFYSLESPVFVNWGVNGNTTAIGNLEVISITPTTNTTFADRNNNSIALRVTFADTYKLHSPKTALFTADIDYSTYPITTNKPPKYYDYLVASHHGGKLKSDNNTLPQPITSDSISYSAVW